MNAALLAAVIASQNATRMNNERLRREREERERREREKRRLQKEIEHRKTSPVVYNEESWQQDRCLKAISMQPCVKKLLSAIELERPKVIKVEEEKYDERIVEEGYNYEVLKQQLDNDIETLKNLGITIKGEQYQLTRLTPLNTQIARPETITEFLGTTFTILDNQPIELNSRILSDNSYYQKKYEETKPEEVEEIYTSVNTKLKKYQSIGKYLRFLLKTEKYYFLKESVDTINKRYDICQQRKKELDSYNSLTKEQLLAIKKYLEHLKGLSEISTRIKNFTQAKKSLRYDANKDVYYLIIKDILSKEKYSEIVNQVYEYINNICENDQETMENAFELVKGMYPITIDQKFLYEFLLKTIPSYKKEETKELKLN